MNTAFLTGKKELQENKKRMADEIASLRHENQTLKDSLCKKEKELDQKHTEIVELKEKFTTLQDEKDKVVDTLKGCVQCVNAILNFFTKIHHSQMNVKDWARRISNSSMFHKTMNYY